MLKLIRPLSSSSSTVCCGLFRLQEFLDREHQLNEEKRLINEHAEQLKESLKVFFKLEHVVIHVGCFALCTDYSSGSHKNIQQPN